MFRQLVIPACLTIALALPMSAKADSNAAGGVIESEGITFTGAPFNMIGVAGTPGNGFTTQTWTGGFSANRVAWSGTMTALVGGTWGDDAGVLMSSPPVGFPPLEENAQFKLDPGTGGYTGTISFSGNAQLADLNSAWAGGIDPVGSWSFQFLDTFTDGNGTEVEATIDSLTMTFQNYDVIDPDGVFTLGTLPGDASDVTSVGEFVYSNTLDTYSFTLDTDGSLDIELFADPGGFTGDNLDSEIGIYDSLGNLIADDDDGGSTGLYSGLFGLNLLAGDYTLVVGGWNTIFTADIGSITAGASTGDYSLVANFTTAVPEPGSACVLGGMFLLGMVRRRRAA